MSSHRLFTPRNVVGFILFLILLVVALNLIGWCVGGVCEVGTDMLLPGRC